MSEEEKNEDPEAIGKEETQENPDEIGENSNSAPTDDELDVIQAQLEEEQAALATAQAALTEKDTRITELESELSQVKSEHELTLADLAATREANTAAVARPTVCRHETCLPCLTRCVPVTI